MSFLLTRTRNLLSSRVRRVLDAGIQTRSGRFFIQAQQPLSGSTQSQKYVGYWLAACCGSVGATVVIGGLTRLTESGLSMTSWHLIKDMKQPSTEEEWVQEFEKYKQYPEFKLGYPDMTLDRFKQIYFLEFVHRWAGRVVGLVFAIPAVVLWSMGHLSPAMKKRSLLFGALIGLQGLLGWYMVKSGLNEATMANASTPHVSQYRLAAHLSLAILLYSGMFWQMLSHLAPVKQALPPGPATTLLRIGGHTSLSLVLLTIIAGAFVAGLDAGLVYNSFPKFSGVWIPSDLFALEPKWKNFFENGTTTQFNHRILGTLTLASVCGLWLVSRRSALGCRGRLAANLMLVMAFTQVGLGIATLLTYVPVVLASLHQTGSLTLLSFLLWLSHEAKRVPK